MKGMAIAALILNFGAIGIYAQQRPVNMTFSGTSTTLALVLASGTSAGEEDFTGNSSLGPFTYHELQAGSAAPTPSSTCSGPTLLNFPIVTGAGIFRFQDGSLLTVKITSGATCVDLSVPVGHVAVTYQITGGTGQLKNAAGNLTLAATSTPILFNAGGPVLFTAIGEAKGTIAF